MYSRNYNDLKPELSLPESYGGIALQGGFATESINSPDSTAASAEPQESEKTEQTFLGGFLANILQKSGISRLSDRLPLLKSLGSEEILIILAALFLFFSREGDKECAIALIILLFIT